MTRAATTQWEFGELFPKETGRKILTVSEITAGVRKLIESNYGTVWISGEVTNLRVQPSGHSYFTLKDASAQIQCVLFRSEGAAVRHLLADDAKMLVQGELTVYEPRGQYQIRVLTVEAQGRGALQEAFERLKQKLQAEGLFAPERKRPIPKYSERLGLVTSLAGAAIQDVFHVIQRRHPGLEILVAPCQVQGQGAAREIAAAIADLNQWSARQPPGRKLDLILITRGGGSLEDLWAFNEEIVARAIHASALPVVSAVGHEIDFTIADFVADLRAATPSAGAEIITEGVFSSAAFVAQAFEWMRHQTGRGLRRREELFASIRVRLQRSHPRRRLQDQSLLLDEAQTRFLRAARAQLRAKAASSRGAAGRLARLHPAATLGALRERLETVRVRLAKQTRQIFDRATTRFAAAQGRLQLLSPRQVLARGYSITLDDQTGAVIRSAASVKPGQALRSKLHDGEVRSRSRMNYEV
jgi:exodeoxyribonuclease VII large subunit